MAEVFIRGRQDVLRSRRQDQSAPSAPGHRTRQDQAQGAEGQPQASIPAGLLRFSFQGQELHQRPHQKPRHRLTTEVERVTVKVLEEAKPGHDLYANVELYAALILHAVGIPPALFTPTFAISRTAGWTAHVIEQFADNLLIRPESVYVGPHGRTFVAVEQR